MTQKIGYLCLSFRSKSGEPFIRFGELGPNIPTYIRFWGPCHLGKRKKLYSGVNAVFLFFINVEKENEERKHKRRKCLVVVDPQLGSWFEAKMQQLVKWVLLNRKEQV